jgi:molecular chaperone GrpE
VSDEPTEKQMAEAGASAPADADPAPETGAVDEAGEGPGDAAVEHDIEDLVAQARTERDEYLDLAQRTKADFENYRRRMIAETSAAARRGRLEVVPGLIEALDNLERVLDNEKIATADALDGGPPDDAPVSLQGVIVAYRDLHSTLKQIDVEAYHPVGEQFDPNLHEALQAVPADGIEAGVVVEVMQRGYRSDDHVIRPARVVVSR